MNAYYRERRVCTQVYTHVYALWTLSSFELNFYIFYAFYFTCCSNTRWHLCLMQMYMCKCLRKCMLLSKIFGCVCVCMPLHVHTYTTYIETYDICMPTLLVIVFIVVLAIMRADTTLRNILKAIYPCIKQYHRIITYASIHASYIPLQLSIFVYMTHEPNPISVLYAHFQYRLYFMHGCVYHLCYEFFLYSSPEFSGTIGSSYCLQQLKLLFRWGMHCQHLTFSPDQLIIKMKS
uniref:Uncharacterized protein n=1 Tax=Glossina morsitans morsitans TaxID=37546 RepID=A0A1B0GA38_GLOMM